jgi:hypothetical protein
VNCSNSARFNDDLGETRWEKHGKPIDESQIIPCKVIHPIPPLAHQHPLETMGALGDEIR